MQTDQQQTGKDDSPGAGGGMTENPGYEKMVREAVDKVAGPPGSIANAAGMHGQKGREKDERPGETTGRETPARGE